MKFRFKTLCWPSFFAGYLFNSAIYSLYQDWHGKDGYIKLINEYWIDACITIPLSILLAFISIFIFFERVHKEKELSKICKVYDR